MLGPIFTQLLWRHAMFHFTPVIGCVGMGYDKMGYNDTTFTFRECWLCCSLWANCQLWLCHSAHPMVQTTCKVGTQIQLTSVWAARLWSCLFDSVHLMARSVWSLEFFIFHIDWYIYTYNNQCYGCWKFCILMIFKRMVIQTWSTCLATKYCE